MTQSVVLGVTTLRDSSALLQGTSSPLYANQSNASRTRCLQCRSTSVQSASPSALLTDKMTKPHYISSFSTGYIFSQVKFKPSNLTGIQGITLGPLRFILLFNLGVSQNFTDIINQDFAEGAEFQFALEAKSQPIQEKNFSGKLPNRRLSTGYFIKLGLKLCEKKRSVET